MATRPRGTRDGMHDDPAISAEVGVIALTVITVVLAVLVYVFAINFL